MGESIDDIIRKVRELDPGGHMSKSIKQKRERIKTCPFCSSPEVELCRTSLNGCWIECASCGARTLSDPLRAEAIKNWNNRSLITGYATVVADDEEDA